jgi:hypothetical protein
MRVALELSLFIVIMGAAFPLPFTQFVVVGIACSALYLLTMHNSFNEGYEAAIEDRIY